MLFRLVVASLLFALSADAQMVPQCICNKVSSCKQQLVSAARSCAENCKGSFSGLGNLNALKGCIQQHEGAIQGTVNCVQNSYPSACANHEGNRVPKRHLGTLKLALSNELMRIFRSWGVKSQADELMRMGNSLFSCMHRCMTDSTGNCEKKMNCGLDLPSDNALASTIINCATQNGFDARGVKNLCQCAVDAGAKQYASTCQRING